MAPRSSCRSDRPVDPRRPRWVTRGGPSSGRTRVHSTGATIRVVARDTASIRDDDPLSARMAAHRAVELERRDRSRVSVAGDLALTADRGTWHLSGRLVACEGDAVIADRPIAVAIQRRIP